MTGQPAPPPWPAPAVNVVPPEREPRPRLLRGSALAATAMILAAGAVVVAAAPAGLALALTAAGVVGVLLAAGLIPRDGDARALLGCAVLLALAPLLRDAGWVVAVDLMLAFCCAAVALAGDRSPAGVLRGPAWAVGLLPAGVGVVGSDLARGLPRTSGRDVAPALRGAVLAATLVGVFGALFASADRAFAHLAQSALPDAPDVGGLPGRLLVAAAFAAVIGALVLAEARLRLAGPAPQRPAPSRRLTPTEWIPGLVAVVVLFCAFVAVQLVVLFGGHEHVLETAGLTYAEYAHEGFGQLVIVTLLVLALLAASWRWVAAEGARRHLLRALLLVLCACTLVVVASALHRLDVYVEAFGATRLRVQAATLCAFLGGTVVFGAVAVLLGRAAWLPRAAVLLVAGTAVAVTVANPDRWIAERNVDRFERTGQIDTYYLGSLSADAAPALARLPREERANAGLVCPARDDGVAGFNAGRAAARRALDC
ncbi:DUF4173 domain-containing protein [Svornostia abyssi]|uniref:DUF4173 domain-containing protein n=1 Tax=Svornostia abyssi TaxID=2898438 RepID=A0ABY5PG26_9ACTN|nr:DUF4173 domain-containing protein [Parviterribacteraceae bacterium J379]